MMKEKGGVQILGDNFRSAACLMWEEENHKHTKETNLNCFKVIGHYIPTQEAVMFVRALIFSHLLWRFAFKLPPLLWETSHHCLNRPWKLWTKNKPKQKNLPAGITATCWKNTGSFMHKCFSNLQPRSCFQICSKTGQQRANKELRSAFKTFTTKVKC